MADNTAVYTGTGRRKEAVARVRLVPGTGKVIRQRTVTPPSTSAVSSSLTTQPAPFRITDTVDSLRRHRALRWRRHQRSVLALSVLGIASLPSSTQGEYRDELKKAGFLTRDSRCGRAQEVRSQEGPQASAVLEALASCSQIFGRGSVVAMADPLFRTIGSCADSLACVRVRKKEKK